MRHCRWWGWLAGAWCALAGLADAAVVTVGPGQMHARVADALRVAQDGDTVQIHPGVYAGDVAVIHQRALTIEGVGERPVLDAAGRHAEGKAIWVVRHGDIRIRNIAFRGARVPDLNGAGIRFERGRLLVQDCVFTDNENAILTSNDATAELHIQDSVFAAAPRRMGALHHLLYVGRIARFEMTGSQVRGGFDGHLVKSRARATRLAYNLLVDGAEGEASYEVDLPNGGDAELVGNVIGQSAQTHNPVLVSYGAEGRAWPDSRLLLAHNTLWTERIGGIFVRVWAERLPPATPVTAVNNLLVGLGLMLLGPEARSQGNLPAPDNVLEDPQRQRFQLSPDSLLRGMVDDPAGLAGPKAVPRAEFKLPWGTHALPAPTQWTPGAYQR